MSKISQYIVEQEDKGMIVFEGDYVKCYNRDGYKRVIRILDPMTVELDNGRVIPADSDVIEDLKSYIEYDKFMNNFELEDGLL